MADVTGADALSLVPTGGGDLVQQLNTAARAPWWPWLLGASVVALLASTEVWWLALLFTVTGGSITCLVWIRERARRRVHVTYEVDGPIADWFSVVTSGWPALVGLGGAWRINTKGALETAYENKVNAGASHLVSRGRAFFRLPAPRILATNVAVPSVTSGSSSLYLLPDRMLLKTGRDWSDVDYGDLHVIDRPQRFIEDAALPRDSQQVGSTWQYVNVKGGPDRRFRDNRQLPVMLYGRLELTSDRGLQWLLDLSKPAVAEWLASVLRARPATQAEGAAGSRILTQADRWRSATTGRGPTPAAVRHPIDAVLHQLPGLPTPVSTRGRVSVVGEAHYQSAISLVVAGRSLLSAGQWNTAVEAQAALVPEPRNSFDANAVRVDLATPGGWVTVGYLSREAARVYQPVLRAMVGRSSLPYAPARICRSSDGMLAVYLHLASPDALAFDNPLPVSAEVLPAGPSAAINGEARHQAELEVYRPLGRPSTRVWATLHTSQVQSGKYSGTPTLEVRLDGCRAGELRAAQAERHALSLAGSPVACEAEVYVGSRNLEVRVFLPADQ